MATAQADAAAAAAGTTKVVAETGAAATASSSDARAAGVPKTEGKSATVGRTFGGMQFAVPTTHDLLENFSATSKLNFFELATIAAIAVQLVMLISGAFPRWLFLVLFAFWRLCYNGGLGLVLHKQSESRWFISKISPWLTEGSPLRDFFRRHLSAKMSSDYNFDTVPIDYNAWLVFRGLVDFVLLNDFSTYVMFALAFAELPTAFSWLEVLRYSAGLALIVFNWFIKIDALRVVKDYAWYWGDFFFLVDGTLTFDGVFQMAPHPMYSIGYIGFYGVSLMSRSYTVLYVSLAAHLCQFLFLGYVENPHIDKIYNSIVVESQELKRRREMLYEGPTAYFRRDLIGFKNFDLFRASDLFTAIIILNTAIFYFSGLPAWFHILQCVAWRLIHTAGIGCILRWQSENKFWTAHFIRHGFNSQDAFANWKSLYNLTMTMTHVSFFFCALVLYDSPTFWFSGTSLLKHTLGLLLMVLHVWTSVEVYEVIRDDGWFYGDFFFSDAHQMPAPKYNGIYRFVNNPEKVMGHAAFYGLAVISDSWIMYALALFSQCATFAFIHYVERPHMHKVYGDEVRERSGLELALLQKMPPKFVEEVRKLHGSARSLVDINAARAFKEVTEPLDKFVDKAKPRIENFVHDISETTRSIVARRAIAISDSLDASRYGVVAPDSAILGEPITVRFTAPADHPPLDWVGLYPHRRERLAPLTTQSSRGLWLYTGRDTAGTLVFTGTRLPLVPGLWECRLHYNDNHGIVAVSAPFAVKLGPAFKDGDHLDRLQAVDLEAHLVTYVRLLVQRDRASLASSSSSSSSIAAPSADEVPAAPLAADVGPASNINELLLPWKPQDRRLRKAMLTSFIRHVYGVDFSASVLDGFPTIARLAEKLYQARIDLGRVTTQRRRTLSEHELSSGGEEAESDLHTLEPIESPSGAGPVGGVAVPTTARDKKLD